MLISSPLLLCERMHFRPHMITVIKAGAWQLVSVYAKCFCHNSEFSFKKQSEGINFHALKVACPHLLFLSLYSSLSSKQLCFICIVFHQIQRDSWQEIVYFFKLLICATQVIFLECFLPESVQFLLLCVLCKGSKLDCSFFFLNT